MEALYGMWRADEKGLWNVDVLVLSCWGPGVDVRKEG